MVRPGKGEDAGFVAKYAPERCLIINKSLRTTVKVGESEIWFLTLWDLIFNDPF